MNRIFFRSVLFLVTVTLGSQMKMSSVAGQESSKPSASAAEESTSGSKESASVDGQVWICELDLESSKSTRLFSLPEFSSAGCLSLAPNGKQIAFDGTLHGQDHYMYAHIFVANMDGTELTDLGPGALPSWSSDSKLLAVSRYDPRGVWILNLQGEYLQCVDANGWGGRWSPKTNELIYTKYGQSGPDFVIYNKDNDTTRHIFGDKGHPYQRLHFNFEWSTAGDRIYFKATRRDSSSEIASVAIDEPRDVRVLFLRNSYANIGLLSDDEFIVPYGAKDLGTVQLYRIKVPSPAPAAAESGKRVAGQFEGRNSYGCAVSADRKKIYYASVPMPDKLTKPASVNKTNESK